MKKRLNYRKLLNGWMQFYSMTAELSRKMFESIWTRLQDPKKETDRKGAEINGAHMERSDRKGET